MSEQNSPLFGYDPDSLADRLDQLFPPDSDAIFDAGADADPLIEIAGRLAVAPKLELSAGALARIQARMNEAIPTPEAQPETPKPRNVIHWPVIVLAAAAAMALTLIVVGRLLFSTGDTSGQIAQQSTATAEAATGTAQSLVILTETAPTTEPTTVVPTVELSDEPTVASTSTPDTVPTEPTATFEVVIQATDTPEPPTATATTALPTTLPSTTEAASQTPSQTASPTPSPSEVPATATHTATTVIIVVPTEIVASPTFTLPPVEPTATMTPTPLPGNLILEGQVEAIEANVVDVYGIDLSVDEDEPLLKVLRVGDFVRVEGSFEEVDGLLIVDVFTIDLVTEEGEGIDVIVNPSNPDEVWRDDGDCSNPPPDWAPAVGWRRRCENAGTPGNSGNKGKPDNPGKPEDPGKPGNPGNPDPGKPDDDD